VIRMILNQSIRKDNKPYHKWSSSKSQSNNSNKINKVGRMVKRKRRISCHSMPRRSLEEESLRILKQLREDSRPKNWRKKLSTLIQSRIHLHLLIKSPQIANQKNRRQKLFQLRRLSLSSLLRKRVRRSKRRRRSSRKRKNYSCF
jgi:hypothetical protein